MEPLIVFYHVERVHGDRASSSYERNNAKNTMSKAISFGTRTNFSKAKVTRQQAKVTRQHLLFRRQDFFSRGFVAITHTMLEYPKHYAHSYAPHPQDIQILHHHSTLRLDRSKMNHGPACPFNPNSLLHPRHPYGPLAEANLVSSDDSHVPPLPIK